MALTNVLLQCHLFENIVLLGWEFWINVCWWMFESWIHFWKDLLMDSWEWYKRILKFESGNIFACRLLSVYFSVLQMQLQTNWWLNFTTENEFSNKQSLHTNTKRIYLQAPMMKSFYNLCTRKTKIKFDINSLLTTTNTFSVQEKEVYVNG